MAFIDSHLVDALLQVMMIAVFIGVFYFTYAKNVEKQVVINTVHYLTSELFKEMASYMPNMNIHSDIQPPNLQSADQEVQSSNMLLIEKAVKSLSILFIFTLLVTYGMSRYLGISYYERLKHNVIILVFIALTEFSFLNIVGRNFITVDPNKIRLNVIKTLQNWSKTTAV